MKKSKVKELLSILDEDLRQSRDLLKGIVTLKGNDNFIFIKKEETKYLVEEVHMPTRSVSYFKLNRDKLREFLDNLRGYN